jgi:rubrerythrin
MRDPKRINKIITKVKKVWKKYPDWICNACGKSYGKRPDGNPHGATYHVNKCGICGEVVEVTEPRDFGHLKKGWDK